MIKNLFAISLIICSLYFSCSKIDQIDNGPKTNGSRIKIELVSGNNQTDTTGNILKYPIIVKVIVNNIATSGYTIQFQGSGCNSDNVITTQSMLDGTAGYDWPLNGDPGQQNLKAYVMDENNQKVDSVTATATAIAPGSGWHRSGCSLQNGSGVAALCKLNTGRVFTCYMGTEHAYLRYSDDNGVNWYPVKSLGNSHAIAYVISSSADELFAFTISEGIFYSKDAGQTWSNTGTLPFDPRLIISASVSSDGKLFITTSPLPPLYISVDKGKTWSSIANSTFIPVNNVNPIFNNLTSDKSGNLYVIEGQNENLFKSTDGGVTWNLIPEGGILYPNTDLSFFIDKNNWFYKSITQSQPGIYISKDAGANYNLMVQTSITAEVENMSLQGDGNFYYEDIQRGLYVYNPTSNTTNLIFGFKSTGAQPYIVANNGNIIVANWGNGAFKYYTK